MPAELSKDLTEGGVTRNLVAFALPLMASTLLQALYNVADMLIVGLFTDASGLSGVSIGGQVTILVTNTAIGIVSGGTVLVAQAHGAKNPASERAAISTTLGLCLLIAVVVTAAMTILSGEVVRLLRTPAESAAQARDYLRICMTGSVFIFGYNALSAIMRGLGDSKRPFAFIAIATATNVVLDLFMVGVLRMGAAGAAWATVASQALSLVLAVAYLARKGFPFSLRIDRRILGRLVGIGLPMALQQLIIHVSFIFLTFLINRYGVRASAAAGVCAKVNSFAILPGIAMLGAVSSMAGQNIGAGRHDRALGTMFAGLRIIVPAALAVFAVVNLFPRSIIGLFSDDPEVTSIGVEYLRFLSADALIASIVFCFSGLLVGAGKTNVTFANSFVSSILLRMPLAWLFSRALGLGMRGIGLAVAVATAISLAILASYVASGRWKRPIAAERSAG